MSGTLQSGRHTCPKCGRKGLGYANHQHAFGWKDYDKAKCRYCKERFSIKALPQPPTTEPKP